MPGMIHCYTGEGKGKTTAAFGLAARNAGRGGRVLFAQFLKGGAPPSGEVLAARAGLPGVEVLVFDQVHPLFDPSVDEQELGRRVRRDFAELRARLARERFTMVVLDEINNCVAQGWLPQEELLEWLRSVRGEVEVVLTGRGAPPALVEAADYVTEMRNLRHPMDSGGRPRRGIEF